MKYSFFSRLSAVLVVVGALVFAVPAFAQSTNSVEKISFFERIGLFFSARKERRLEKLKEFVAETVIEEAPMTSPLEVVVPVDTFGVPSSLPVTEDIVGEVPPTAFEEQSLEPMNQQTLFEFLAQ